MKVVSFLLLLALSGFAQPTNPPVSDPSPWETSDIGAVWSDSFNRASLGSNWVVLGSADASIVSNELRFVQTNLNSSSLRSPATEDGSTLPSPATEHRLRRTDGATEDGSPQVYYQPWLTCADQWTLRWSQRFGVLDASSVGVGVGIKNFQVEGGDDQGYNGLLCGAGANLGKMVLERGGGTSQVLLTMGPAMALEAGNIVDCWLTRSGWTISATASNRANRQVSTTSLVFSSASASTIPPISRMCFYPLGGTTYVSNLSFAINHRKPARFVVIGASIGEGDLASTYARGFVRVVQSNFTEVVCNESGSWNGTGNALSLLPEILAHQPGTAILTVGANDLYYGYPAGQWQENYSTLVAQLQANGVTVKHCLPTPETYTDQWPLVAWLLANYPAGDIIDHWTPFVGDGYRLASAYDGGDGVHPNDAGHLLMGQIILAHLLPAIHGLPQSLAAAEGGNATFTVSVTGAAPLGYQWHFNGVPLAGATGTSLVISNFDLTNAGAYSLVVTNAYGYATQIAALRLTHSPVVRLDGVDVGGGAVSRADSSQVTMSSTFGPDADIYYTLDGSEPDFTAIPYSGAFTLTNSATIRAIAYNFAYTDWAESAPIYLQISPTYPLSASTPGGGSISVSPAPYAAGNLYVSNTIVTLTATPSHGWAFVGWTGDSTATSNVTTVVMDRPRTVQALFEMLTTYPLSASTPGGGSVSFAPPPYSGSNLYVSGTLVTLAATPAYGWDFVRWIGDSTATSTVTTVVMDQPRAVQALFQEWITYPLSVSTPGGGSVSASPAPYKGSDLYVSGTPVTLTATPSNGWSFVRWLGDSTATTNVTTVVMDQPRTVQALFQEWITYPLSASTPGGGSVSASAAPYRGTNLYVSGTHLTLTATPSNGWSFVRWLGDSTATTNVTTVVIDQPRTVQAVFGTSLSLFTNGSGQLALSSPTGPYPFGSTLQLTARPSEGYYLFGWANAASGFANPLLFTVTNPTPGITVLFGKLKSNQVSLTVLPNGNGAVTIDPARNVYTNGDTVTLTTLPATDYAFTGWSGDTSGNLNPLFLTLNTNKHITANFASTTATNPPPVFQTVVRAAGTLTFTWSAVPGLTYQVQYTTNLHQANWSNLGSATLATSDAITASDSVASGPSPRWYRVALLP